MILTVSADGKKILFVEETVCSSERPRNVHIPLSSVFSPLGARDGVRTE